MELFVFYILPNFVLFGGLYAVGKSVEKIMASFIENGYVEVRSHRIYLG